MCVTSNVAFFSQDHQILSQLEIWSTNDQFYRLLLVILFYPETLKHLSTFLTRRDKKLCNPKTAKEDDGTLLLYLNENTVSRSHLPTACVALFFTQHTFNTEISLHKRPFFLFPCSLRGYYRARTLKEHWPYCVRLTHRQRESAEKVAPGLNTGAGCQTPLSPPPHLWTSKEYLAIPFT